MIEYFASNLSTVLCMLFGAGLVIFEVFLPGFGLPGISGLILIGIGTILAAINHGMLIAVAILLVLIAVLAVTVSWILNRASRGTMNGKIFLHDKEELHMQKDMQAFIGKKGMTLSVLRPAGIGDFDGVRLNIVTEGGFIEKDMPIEIIRVDGSRIVVRAQ